jgi:hypothetical protein
MKAPVTFPLLDQLSFRCLDRAAVPAPARKVANDQKHIAQNHEQQPADAYLNPLELERILDVVFDKLRLIETDITRRDETRLTPVDPSMMTETSPKRTPTGLEPSADVPVHMRR